MSAAESSRGARARRVLLILLAIVAGGAVPFMVPGGARVCDYVGKCAPTPRDVGPGDCVRFEKADGTMAELKQIVDCSDSQPAVIIAVGTLNDAAAEYGQAVGTDSFCREAAHLWLSDVPAETAVDVRIATDGADPEALRGGDTFACIASRSDGQEFTDEFDAIRPR